MPNDPGKPWQDGADESFNGGFRDEYLSIALPHKVFPGFDEPDDWLHLVKIHI